MTQVTAGFPNMGCFFVREMYSFQMTSSWPSLLACISVTSPSSNGVGFLAVRPLACREVCKWCRHLLPSLPSRVLFSLFFTQLVSNLSVDSRSRVEEHELSNSTLAAGVQDPTYPCHMPRKATNQDVLSVRWNLLNGGWNCTLKLGIRKVQMFRWTFPRKSLPH